MAETDYDSVLSLEESRAMILAAAKAFKPRTPISTKALFAGRWNQLTTLADAVAQPGLHIVIYGERGVGKTSLANVIAPLLQVIEQDTSAGGEESSRFVVKVNTHQGDSFHALWHRVFQEVRWQENKPVLGFAPTPESRRITLTEAFDLSESPSIDDVRRVLSAVPGSVFIFDEFDRGSNALQSHFTDLIKSLSDYEIDSTVVLVGVAATIDSLVRDHQSIVRSITQIFLPRMRENELKEIIVIGSKEAGVAFEDDATNLVVRTSQGLPHYTHLIGLNATREAAKSFTRRVTLEHVHKSFDECVKNAFQTTQDLYLRGTRSAHKDAIYREVLMACALASSASENPHGEFYSSDVVAPLSVVLGKPTTLATFQSHLPQFCDASRGPVLIKDGSPRSYRYRFAEPLLPPYIYMSALRTGLVTPAQLNSLLRAPKTVV